MYKILHRNVDVTIFSKLMKYYSLARKSHYEVLRLQRNCSDKEIKAAFIKLSKEYHPDKNKNSNAQQHFVRIVEAYNVLGKPSSRAHYDNLTAIENASFYRPHNIYNNMRHSPPPNQFYETYARGRARQSTQNMNQAPYYGSVGVKRIPKYVLVLLCFGIALVGTVLQIFVIRYKTYDYDEVQMYVVQKRLEIEKSKRLTEELNRVREAAVGNTNEMQTRLLLEKIVGSANPTIATASLGQALATADKNEPPPAASSESILSDLGLSDVSHFWYSPDPTHEVHLTDIVRKIRMCIYYYYSR